MQNELEIDILTYITPLRRLEELGQKMSHSSWLERAPDESAAGQSEFVRLQEELPLELFTLLRTRISSTRRLVAPMRRAKCTACYMSIPRGDEGAVRLGRQPVLCQHCGVLLYPEEAEQTGSALGAK